RLRDAADSTIISSPDRLRAVELDLSRLRMVDLAIHPVAGRFDFLHFTEIHRRLFSDVFPWAGHQRVGPQTAMIRFAPDAVLFSPADPSAPMTKYTFASGPEIPEAVSAVFSQLEYLARRTSIERAELLSIMAELGAELFAIHPFRDGNARTIWAYGVQLDESLGMEVDFSQMLAGARLHTKVLPSTYRYQATGDFGGYFMALDSALSPSEAAARVRDVDAG
ncbi:MAG: cell filamentation protein, partial [Subtercola sp.]|nr:cell filamentation protein [Subtercola sp.]